MKRILFLFLLNIIGIALVKGQNITVSGYIKDASSGETLIGATVIDSISQNGTTSNAYGFYSLTIPSNEATTLVYTYIGFDEVRKRITATSDITIDLELGFNSQELSQVTVTANSAKEQVNSTQMSVDRLSTKDAKLLPALFGEVDILKTIQLKPGVQSAGEGSSGIVVRGGGPDQNLIILDEALVYNPSHLFGFFSTFNSDAVKNVELYKGGFPSQYGGRLSSVIDVKLRDGNRKKYSAQGGLGLIASRLTLEGPIVKDKGSFIVSGRRTYADIFTRIANNQNTDNPDWNQIPDYFFYDLNAKFNYDITEKDRIFISGYFGRDVFGFNTDDFSAGFDWGNITTTARWNHIFNPKLFTNTTFTFSDYDYLINSSFDVIDFEVGSGITDVNFKTDFYYAPNNKHNIRFGADVTQHKFNVGRLSVESDELDDPIFSSDTNIDATEMAVYISDDIEVSKKLSINVGLRGTGFNNETFYAAIEPRASMKYSLSDDVSVKGSYTRMNQYVHLVSNSGASLPTDVWYPSNEKIKPQQSDQVAAGVSAAIGQSFLLTNELYYKWQRKQIDFKDGADLFINPNLDDEFVFGTGYSYGNEIYLEKKEGKFRGWIGYTLSWSWREFEDINDGKRFAPRFDRRHDISVVAIYNLSKKFQFSGSWVYQTGNNTSLPEARFYFQDVDGTRPNIGTIYIERNSFRMAPYSRLDFGITMNVFMKKPNFDGNLNLSVYNAYDRRNPFFLYYDTETDNNNNILSIQPKQVSLFPILPSLTFNFEFK